MKSIVAIFLFAVFSCQTNAQTQYRFVDSARFNIDVTFNVVNDSILNISNPEDTVRIKNYIHNYFPTIEISRIDSIKFDYLQDDDYLILFCNQGQPLAHVIGFSVNLIDNRLAPDLDLGGGYAHSCSGAPCSCCRFLKDKKGTVYGCYCHPGCQRRGDRCNHTVTEH